MNMSDKSNNKTLSFIVNQLIANQGVLFVKLHQYHWYVQGPQFFTLHSKFEELYNETIAQFDVFAERLIARGEKPYSTLGEFIEHSTISEKPYQAKLSAEVMVNNLVEDYNEIKKLTLEGIELADDEDDSVTEDMLIGYIESIEKTLWMLKAFLGSDVE